MNEFFNGNSLRVAVWKVFETGGLSVYTADRNIGVLKAP